MYSNEFDSSLRRHSVVKIDCEDREDLGSKQTELTKVFSPGSLVAVAFRKVLAVAPLGLGSRQGQRHLLTVPSFL